MYTVDNPREASHGAPPRAQAARQTPRRQLPAHSGSQEKDPDTIKVFRSPETTSRLSECRLSTACTAEGYRATTLLRDPSTGTDMTATTEEWLSPDSRSLCARLRRINVSRISLSHRVDQCRSVIIPDPGLFKLPKEYAGRRKQVATECSSHSSGRRMGSSYTPQPRHITKENPPPANPSSNP